MSKEKNGKNRDTQKPNPADLYDERTVRKEDRITALYNKGLFEPKLPKKVRFDIQTEAGRLVGEFTPHDVSPKMAEFFAMLFCISHKSIPSDAKKWRRLFNKTMRKMAERAAAIYIEELKEQIAEAIELAPKMACGRGMAELEGLSGYPTFDTKGLLANYSKDRYDSAIIRWGIKKQRKPSVFSTWPDFLMAYITAAQRLDKITQQAIAEEIARLPGLESYSTRQLQRDIERLKEFGFSWVTGRGVVIDNDIFKP